MTQSEMTSGDFEEFVRLWIDENIGVDKSQLTEVTRLGSVAGAGGIYKIDVLVRFKILQGAQIVVLAECKHLKRAVEREEIQVLESKLRDVGAHKGIVFSTSGFQARALEYALARGIAAVNIELRSPPMRLVDIDKLDSEQRALFLTPLMLGKLKKPDLPVASPEPLLPQVSRCPFLYRIRSLLRWRN
jgi:hypothetical protein